MTPRFSPEGEELDTVADPGEGPGGRSRGGRRGPKSRKNSFWRPPPPPPNPFFIWVSRWPGPPLTYLKVWIRHCRQTQVNGGNRTHRKRSEHSIGPILLTCYQLQSTSSWAGERATSTARNQPQKLAKSSTVTYTGLQSSRLHVRLQSHSKVHDEMRRCCLSSEYSKRQPPRIVNY